MTPAATWLLLAGVWLFVAVVVYGAFVTGSRGVRREEEILRRHPSNVYQLDSTKIPLALKRQRERVERYRKVKGVRSNEPGEVPPGQDVA